MKNIKKNKEYKALILDLDGTSIPHKHNALPSKRVTEAIRRARAKIYVGIATSRPYYAAAYIIEHLQLSGPCIVNNGAQVIDARSRAVLREQGMFWDDVLAVYKETQKLNIPLRINTMNEEVSIEEKSRLKGRVLGAEVFPPISAKLADLLIERISYIPTIAVSKIPSYERGEFYVGISHASATKQHGILEVAKILGIKTQEIIGVGDGDNDFPLLMACGLRIAMGNAVEGLKEIADYIAPPVFEDGVVDVIEKFVLKKKLEAD